MARKRKFIPKPGDEKNSRTTGKPELLEKWKDRKAYMPQWQDQSDNDPRWYSYNADIVRDFASYPYGWPLGNILQMRDGKSGESAPGVMCFYWSPTIGDSIAPTSPINVAANAYYSFVRYQNSGAANYEAVDLMMYTIAMDSAYIMYAYMRRIVKVMRMYSATNKFYPYGILRAMGVDPDDFIQHIADFRGFVNEYAIRIGSRCVPNSMSYMARHMWMCDHIFVDDQNSDKAQTYLFSPHAVYQFGYDSEGRGMLQYTPLPTGLTSVATLEKFALDLIAPIWSDMDSGIMSGDILKAFGKDGVFKLGSISESEVLMPEYSEEVLSQIENLTMMPYYDSEPSNNFTPPSVNLKAPNGDNFYSSHVYQVYSENVSGPDAFIFARPSFNYLSKFLVDGILPAEEEAQALRAYTDKRIITMHHGGVTADDTMVATRLTNMLDNDTSGTQAHYYARTLGSEVVHAAQIYYYSRNAVGVTQFAVSPQIFTGNLAGSYRLTTGSSTTASAGAVVGAVQETVQIMRRIEAFDWHPGVYNMVAAAYQTSSDPVQFLVNVAAPDQPAFDIDYYTLMDGYDLARMAEAALLNEFAVEQMGKFGQL